MIIIGVLTTLLLLVLAVLSVPVRIRVESSMVFIIRWLFIKLRFQTIEGGVSREFRVFNRKTRFFSGEKPPKETSVGKQKKKTKKKKKKVTKEMVMEVLKDKIVKKVLRICCRFILRCLKSIRITFFDGQIGLKDYYLQGIVFGLLHSLPSTESVNISGNFQEVTEFEAEISISILRLAGALLILLLSFPYLNTFLVYRRVYLQKGRA